LKRQIIHFLLLFSLLFNIAHACVIATEDTCHNESTYEYVMQQEHATDCADLCKIHHLFHYTAIVASVQIYFDINHTKTLFVAKPTYYNPPFKETSIKPPIA